MSTERADGSPDEARIVRMARVLAWSGVAFVVAYAGLRVHAVLTHPEPNPATVVSSQKIAYFIRLQLCAYVAGMAAIGLSLVPRGALARLDRRLPVAIGIACAILVAQAVVAP